MKCPACFSEIDDRSYRCRHCRRICSYRRLCWRYRYFLLIIIALGVLLATTVYHALAVNRAAGWLLVPYLLWILYASTLNAGIVALNP